MANAGRLMVALGFKVDQASMRRAEAKLRLSAMRFRKIQERAGRVGSSLQNIGRGLSRYVAAPILVAGAAIAKVSGDFETAINILEAKTGEGGQALNAMREEAKRLGTTTKFTASQAAGGMIEFAKAGLSAKQIVDAIAPALDFATASQMEMSDVAKITANTLAQFGFEANKSRMIADLFTKTADSATTNVQDLADAMVKVGGVAKASGLSFKEALSLLGGMANVGITGAEAGTALSNSMIHLAKPTKNSLAAFDRLGLSVRDFVNESGTLKRPLTDLFRALGNAGAGMADLTDIFELRAARNLVGIIKDIQKADVVAAKLAASTGNASKQADTTMKGFNGALLSLKSALEGVAIAIGDAGLREFFTGILLGLTALSRSIATLSPVTLRWVTIIAAAAAGLAGLTFVVGSSILMFKGLSAAFVMAGTSAGAMWLKIIAPIAAAIAMFALFFAIGQDIGVYLSGTGKSFTGYLVKNVLDPVIEWIMKLYDFIVEWSGKAWDAAIAKASVFFSYLQDEIQKIASIPLVAKIISFVDKVTPDLKEPKRIARPFAFGGGTGSFEFAAMARAGARGGGGGISNNTSNAKADIVINVNGAGNPEETARAVKEELADTMDKVSRSSASPMRQ